MVRTSLSVAILLRSGLGRQPQCTALVLTANSLTAILCHTQKVATGRASSAPPTEEQTWFGSAGWAAGRAVWPPQKVKLHSLRAQEVGQGELSKMAYVPASSKKENPPAVYEALIRNCSRYTRDGENKTFSIYLAMLDLPTLQKVSCLIKQPHSSTKQTPRALLLCTWGSSHKHAHPRPTRKGFCPRKPRARHHTMLLGLVTTKNQLVCTNRALQHSSLWDNSDCRSFRATCAVLPGRVMKAASPLTLGVECLVLQSKALKIRRAAHPSKLKPEVTTTTHLQLSTY